jgi:flavodoxin
MKRFRKWLGVPAAVMIVAVVGHIFVVTLVDSYQARTNATQLARGVAPASSGSRAAVVYYSRSGNTALMAQRIAQRQRAALYRIEAPDYQVGLIGWVHALADARKHESVITPRSIDLTAYHTVYIGSPIWLYSPAPPIWQFVALNRFDGKHVVLFNTFNSQFKPEFIEAFRLRVMEQGARSFEHRSVRRGRMGLQLSTEEMLQAVDAAFPASNSP